MRRFDLVVWDWDGTVIDSIGAVSGAIMAAAADLDLPPPTAQQARWVIGLGLTEAVVKAVPSIRPEQVGPFVERYRAHYLKRDPELNLFAGMEMLLRGLDAAGVPLAVATGKSRVGLNRVLDRTGLGRHFVATRCADEGVAKPDPWMLRDLSESLLVPRERMVMIGDTTHDVAMAHAAGTASVAVTYGAHDKALLRQSQPNIALDSVAELASWLARACAIDPQHLGGGAVG
jgi:phosphoglycolate phosphatase